MHQCARETKHCPSQTAHALHPVITVFSMLPSHLYTWRGTCQNALYFFMQIIPLPEMPWLNPEARDSVRIPFCVCVSTNTESPASLPINNKHVPSKLRERPTSTRLQMQRNACHPCKSLFPRCSYPLQYKFKGSSSSVSYFIQCTIMRSQRAGWSRKVKLPLWMYGSV